MTGHLALLHSADDPVSRSESKTFEDVYAIHAGSIYRFCLSQVGDGQVAADLTHDTFIKAFEAYERVRPDAATIRTWLVRIARNCCIDFHRQHNRWRRLLERLQRSSIPGDVETVVHNRSELARVNAAIAKLRPRERDLVGLRVAGGLSFRQIAEVMGISEQVAKVATHRALVKLRTQLEDGR